MCPEARKPVFPHPSFLQAGAAGWSRGHDLDVEAGEPRLPEKTVITLKTVSSRSHGLTNTWGLRILTGLPPFPDAVAKKQEQRNYVETLSFPSGQDSSQLLLFWVKNAAQ